MAKNKRRAREKNGKGHDHVLEGNLCLGREWIPDMALFFHMRFKSCDFVEARKNAMNRLKAYARRHMKKCGEKAFLLQGVSLQCCLTDHKTALRPDAKNNGLLYKNDPFEVFF